MGVAGQYFRVQCGSSLEAYKTAVKSSCDAAICFPGLIRELRVQIVCLLNCRCHASEITVLFTMGFNHTNTTIVVLFNITGQVSPIFNMLSAHFQYSGGAMVGSMIVALTHIAYLLCVTVSFSHNNSGRSARMLRQSSHFYHFYWPISR